MTRPFCNGMNQSSQLMAAMIDQLPGEAINKKICEEVKSMLSKVEQNIIVLPFPCLTSNTIFRIMRPISIYALLLSLILQFFAPSLAFVSRSNSLAPNSRSSISVPESLPPLFSSRENVEESQSNFVVEAVQQLSPAELVFISGILLLLATITPLTSSATGGEGNIEHGETLFANNCASCHRGGQNFMKPSKTLQESDLLKNLGDSDSATVASFFKGSMQHKMLSFPNVPGGKLTESDVDDVAIYVSSQAVQNKW